MTHKFKRDIFAIDPVDAWPFADDWVRTGSSSFLDMRYKELEYESNLGIVALCPNIPACLRREISDRRNSEQTSPEARLEVLYARLNHAS